MEAPIPKEMEKPPLLNEYNDIADLVDHIDEFETMIHYHNIGGPIKCRLFPMMMIKITMDRYKNLSSGSITSWRSLKNQFINNFTASRRHPKTEPALEAIA